VSETPFVFGLERVRELRAHDEDRAREHLAASLADRLRGEAQLRAASDRLRRAQTLGGPADGEALTGAVLLARQAWTERLERSIDLATQDLTDADAVVAARRDALVHAGRKREALDRLRDRKLATHRLEAGRRETAVLDEIALRAHGSAPRSAA
jgi:flagellar FliJ protein